jgi:hypothetical protein
MRSDDHFGGKHSSKAIRDDDSPCSRHHSFHDRMPDSSDFHAELRMRNGGIGFRMRNGGRFFTT